jgi:6-pyruvoyltetrahydropterin/6-carboxytetrahydropterin synthase
MTRRLTFSAARADWLESRSRQENIALFGPQAAPEPYGHHYTLDVSVEGRIDPQTGILVNIKEIDRIVRERALSALDRKFLNRQVPAFAERPPTTENLAVFLVETLAPHMPPEVTLAALRLEETPTSAVEWRADERARKKESNRMLLTRSYEFSASHRLYSPALSEAENWELFGKCSYANGHGHNYEVEVTVSGPIEERAGRVMDTAVLDAIVEREILERYDHRHLNYDAPEFAEVVPSAENITKAIWERLQPQIPAPARLHRILLRETARNIFEYFGEDDQER